MFTNLSVSERLDFFHVLANENNTVINMNLQNSQDPIFNYCRYIARSGIVGSCGTCIFNFLQNLHNILQTMKRSEEVKSLSRVRLFVTPWTVGYQAPLSMGFSRQ